jgi:large subunit ribosomal protein L4
MELEVLDKAGKSTGRKVSLPESVFGIEPSKHAIYLDVKQYLANQRQGTHKSKEKGEITASTKKIKKQKGTGGARAGSLKSPVFVGGGRIFGPKPRDYSFKLNKKLKVVARRSALATQFVQNNVLVVEDFSLEQPKTKEFTSILNSFNLNSSRVTYVVTARDKNLYLSSRNIQKFKLISLDDVNTYDLLNCKKLILSESSVKELENRLS